MTRAEAETDLRAWSVSRYYEYMSTYRLQVLIPVGLDTRIKKAAHRQRLTKGAWVRRVIERALVEDRGAGDALDRLSHLGAPTADIDQMLAEIEAGRG